MKTIGLESTEQINGVYDGEKYDFDRYNFVERSPFSTKEISVVVDFKNEEITGDKIAYGSWYEIETCGCVEFLETLKTTDIKRDFTSILDKHKTEGAALMTKQDNNALFKLEKRKSELECVLAEIVEILMEANQSLDNNEPVNGLEWAIKLIKQLEQTCDGAKRRQQLQE